MRTDNILSAPVVTIHEYEQVAPTIARVTMSVANYTNATELTDAAIQAVRGSAAPVRGSFRWLDAAKTSIVGFMSAIRPAITFEPGKTPGYRAIAKNMFMSEEDQSLWAVKEGASSKYLVRQGEDNLTAVLASARVSPTGNQPRMRSIVSASVDANEFVSFVHPGENVVQIDYGFAVQAKNDDGALLVVSHLLGGRNVVVPTNLVVSSHEVPRADLPKIPADKVTAYKQTVTAASAQDAVLSPADYYRLAYSTSPDYVAKIIRQIEEMAAM